jgi:hypothetical protein
MEGFIKPRGPWHAGLKGQAAADYLAKIAALPEEDRWLLWTEAEALAEVAAFSELCSDAVVMSLRLGDAVAGLIACRVTRHQDEPGVTCLAARRPMAN